MSSQLKIEKSQNGVDINIMGSVIKTNIESLIDSCSDGACKCSEEFLSKIDGLKVSGKDGDVTISIKSKFLTKEDITKNMQKCGCEF